METMINSIGKQQYENDVLFEEETGIEEYITKLRSLKDHVRILLAEDNKINQKVVRAMLKQTKINMDIADDGQHALEMLSKNQYDIVLMDVQMPRMDGFSATRNIRKDLKLAKIPVIAMTAHAMKGDREKMFGSRHG